MNFLTAADQRKHCGHTLEISPNWRRLRNPATAASHSNSEASLSLLNSIRREQALNTSVEMTSMAETVKKTVATCHHVHDDTVVIADDKTVVTVVTAAALAGALHSFVVSEPAAFRAVLHYWGVIVAGADNDWAILLAISRMFGGYHESQQ